MGAVVWDSILESEFPAMTTFGGYEKYARESVPIPVSHQHHHHYNYPSGVYHTLGNLAEGLTHKKNITGEFAHWTPTSDVRETKIAYHIEMEVPGVSDKKAIKIECLSPRTLQVEGTALRPDLIRGREGDGEAVWKSDSVSNGDVKKAEVNGEDAQDGGPCTKCADSRDSESEMTMKIIHGERKIGLWRRIFTLPIDCDMTTVKAKLDAGLLHISIFKKQGLVGEDAKMVEIE